MEKRMEKHLDLLVLRERKASMDQINSSSPIAQKARTSRLLAKLDKRGAKKLVVIQDTRPTAPRNVQHAQPLANSRRKSHSCVWSVCTWDASRASRIIKPPRDPKRSSKGDLGLIAGSGPGLASAYRIPGISLDVLKDAQARKRRGWRPGDPGEPPWKEDVPEFLLEQTLKWAQTLTPAQWPASTQASLTHLSRLPPIQVQVGPPIPKDRGQGRSSG